MIKHSTTEGKGNAQIDHGGTQLRTILQNAPGLPLVDLDRVVRQTRTRILTVHEATGALLRASVESEILQSGGFND
jgi:hypothetical protein